MHMRRIVSAAAIAGLMCTAGAAAQSVTTERTERTKIEIKGGKDVTKTGCLARSGATTDYVLTDEAGRVQYALVTNDDLSQYVSRRVEVKGRAADRGDGKVRIEHKTEGTSGEKSESKLEAKGDATFVPYLGLKSIKTVGSSCK